MNTTLFHRAIRKLVRPVRRALLGKSTASSITDLTGDTLILIAHPDDEVFCSGLICELLSRGENVHLVAFTRGEGGERIDISSDLKLGQVREKELREAAQELGTTSLTFLDYVDPEISADQELQEPPHDSAELLAELEALCEKLSPSQLITHGSSGEYWHPAHLCLYRNARNLQRRLPQLALWTFNAWTREHPLQAVLNQDDSPNLTLEASAHQEQRLRALTAHHSQREVFERFSKGSLADFIAMTSVENYHKW